MISLQIQSVIYKNTVPSLLRAIEGLDNAILYCHKNGLDINAKLCYGDASLSPVLEKQTIDEIQNSYDNLSFEYSFFGFNSGTAQGHNRLGEKCDAEYMMIMNPDVILESRCIYELLSSLQDDKVGMAEARQTPLELSKTYDMDTLETEWASTACTVFKSQIFRQLNGFDYLTFFMYCDDLDFSWRMRLAGYKIIYNPRAVVFHAKTLSSAGSWKPTSAEIYYSAEAAILMAYKYSNPARVEKLLRQFDTVGGEDEKKAANAFRKRRRENNLPAPIDSNHKVAKFIGDYYSEMRFDYSK